MDLHDEKAIITNQKGIKIEVFFAFKSMKMDDGNVNEILRRNSREFLEIINRH